MVWWRKKRGANHLKVAAAIVDSEVETAKFLVRFGHDMIEANKAQVAAAERLARAVEELVKVQASR